RTVVDSISRERVAAQVSGIRAMGETCISCGLDLAMAMMTPSFGATSSRVSRILLLSDGEATAGVRDVTGFQQMAARARGQGTTVSTIGVDVEYNHTTMGALAQFSNGRHYFVESSAGLPAVFDQELESLSRTLANDVSLVVELAEGV